MTGGRSAFPPGGRAARAAVSLLARWLIAQAGGRSRSAAMARAGRSGGRVLELGVGAGKALGRYRGDIEVTGADWREGLLTLAAARLARRACPRVAGLALTAPAALPFARDTFDGALAAMSLSALADPAGALGELMRVVRPGGEIIVADHFAWRPGAPAGPGPGPGLAITDLIAGQGATMTTMRRLAPLGLFTLVCLRVDEVIGAAGEGRDAAETAPAAGPRAVRRRRAARRQGAAGRTRPRRRRRLTG